MKYKIDHDYHIHSYLSLCSKNPEQNNERILQYARDNGLHKICLTNHYWDSEVHGASDWYLPQNYDYVSRAKPLPNYKGIDFLFGCECEMDKHKRLSIPEKRFKDFSFIIVPTTHLHMTGFTIADEDADNCERRAILWVERLDTLLNMPLPFKKLGLAHLASPLIYKWSTELYCKVLNLIPNEDMERLFAKAASLGCGIELNQSDMSFSDGDANTVLRMFRIAKSCGCKFYLGSDSHRPKEFEGTKEVFERAIRLLDLSEDDKFHINL